MPLHQKHIAHPTWLTLLLNFAPIYKMFFLKYLTLFCFIGLAFPAMADDDFFECEGPYKGKEISQAQLAEILKQHQALLEEKELLLEKEDYEDIRYANLCHIDLKKANLNDAYLLKAKLSGADLSYANLTGAKLNGADLSYANLTGADLSYANLTKDATLTEVNLTNATLTEANLTGAGLYKANLTNAQLYKVNFTGAFLQYANLTNANLTRANLTDSQLYSINLTRAKLEDANLTSSELEDANLTEANLSYANLSYANLTKADLTKANLSDADLTGANLKAATLKNSYFFGVNLYKTDFFPKTDSLPNTVSFRTTKNFLNSNYYDQKHGAPVVQELLAVYKKLGMHRMRRLLTYMIKKEQRKASMVKELEWKNVWEKLGAVFSLILFELPSLYGAKPQRALTLLVISIFIFSFFYWIGLKRGVKIEAVWEPILLNNQKKNLRTKIKHPYVYHTIQLNPQKRCYSELKLIRLAFHISLNSAFKIGWKELDFGTWMKKLQKREYHLETSHIWIKSICSIQSLLGIYLVALWLTTQFGQPFDY